MMNEYAQRFRTETQRWMGLRIVDWTLCASRAMRGLVIDYVRTRYAQKRGGDLTFTTLDEGRVGAAEASPQLVA